MSIDQTERQHAYKRQRNGVTTPTVERRDLDQRVEVLLLVWVSVLGRPETAHGELVETEKIHDTDAERSQRCGQSGAQEGDDGANEDALRKGSVDEIRSLVADGAAEKPTCTEVDHQLRLKTAVKKGDAPLELP